MRPVTIVAEMQDGTCIVEHVRTFEDFTAIVLPFRADAECVRLTWHDAIADDETLYESQGACPWYQSVDLDFDAAQAAAARTVAWQCGP